MYVVVPRARSIGAVRAKAVCEFLPFFLAFVQGGMVVGLCYPAVVLECA